MTLSSSELVDVHAIVGRAEELVDRRRATYEVAIELAAGYVHAASSDASVVDHPMVRGHLGDVLTGTAELDTALLTSVEELVTDAGRWWVADAPVRLASDVDAPAALSPAMARIAAEVARHGVGGPADVVLHDGSPGFTAAASTLRRGIELASDAAPALVRDLLPHVGLLAMLDRAAAGSLGSASAREFPGLIVLPAPATPLEAAEALVHEGAHQKLFDMAIVGSVFEPRYHQAARFLPPWGSATATAWPYEQTVAAYHAYTCLAAFWKSVQENGPEPHSYSLLPVAAERAAALGAWLEGHAGFLGRDGRTLLSGLLGRPVDGCRGDDLRAADHVATSDSPVQWRRVGSWCLSMRWARPVDIIWTAADAISDEAVG